MPMASGNPPNRAAIVVIIIGGSAATCLINGLDRWQSLVALGLQAKSIIMMAFFFTCLSAGYADERDDAQVGSGSNSARIAPTPAAAVWKNRQGWIRLS